MTENRFLSWRVEKVKTASATVGGVTPVAFPQSDILAVEEPLEIQVATGSEREADLRTVTVTMRTPGHDAELAVGFLAGEGILRAPSEVEGIDLQTPHSGRQIRVRLGTPSSGSDSDFASRLDRIGRLSYASSACGVCGKASLRGVDESLAEEVFSLASFSPPVPVALVADLPRRLRAAQAVFDRTGGLHAAGLFDLTGHALVVREDVGRHNAVDKVVGHRFLAGGVWPPEAAILVVSGRASFELVQKAVAARIPLLVAVGAPSSLAAETARHFGLTLVGFTRSEGFNVYTGGERIGPVTHEAHRFSEYTTDPSTIPSV